MLGTMAREGKSIEMMPDGSMEFAATENRFLEKNGLPQNSPKLGSWIYWCLPQPPLSLLPYCRTVV
jgi:hypothetical protein